MMKTHKTSEPSKIPHDCLQCVKHSRLEAGDIGTLVVVY